MLVNCFFSSILIFFLSFTFQAFPPEACTWASVGYIYYVSSTVGYIYYVSSIYFLRHYWRDSNAAFTWEILHTFEGRNPANTDWLRPLVANLLLVVPFWIYVAELWGFQWALNERILSAGQIVWSWDQVFSDGKISGVSEGFFLRFVRWRGRIPSSDAHISDRPHRRLKSLRGHWTLQLPHLHHKLLLESPVRTYTHTHTFTHINTH